MAKTDPKAQRKVRQVMHEFKEGELKSGQSGRKVTDPKQAVAIGLSEARRAGAKVAKPKQRANAPLADDDTASVAGEEDPGASLDTAAVSPAPPPASAPDGTSRARTPRRG